MGIAFVQAAASGNTTAASAFLGISPTAGNALVVGLGSQGPSSPGVVNSIVDNGTGSAAYTRLVSAHYTAGTLINADVELWVCSAVGTGVSMLSAAWNQSPYQAAQVIMGAEYSGVAGIGGTVAPSGTNLSALCFLTTQDSNNVLAAFNYVNNYPTSAGPSAGAGIGTLRLSWPSATYLGAAWSDNSAAAPQSVSSDIVFSSVATGWQALGVELRSGGAAPAVTHAHRRRFFGVGR